MQSEQINELATALSKAQGEMKAAPLTKTNPHFRSKYADLSAIIDAVRPALAKHNLSVTQTTQMRDDGAFILETTMLHSSGQWVRGEWPLPSGVKPQEMGSATTYAKRYSLAALCCIAADEDDDGNAAQKQEPAKPAAKPAAQPAPAVEPLPVDSPHMVKVPLSKDGESPDWREWAMTFAATIRACPTAEDVQAWVEANTAPLKNFKAAAPKMAANLEKAISECLTQAPSKEAA